MAADFQPFRDTEQRYFVFIQKVDIFLHQAPFVSDTREILHQNYISIAFINGLCDFG